MGGKNDEEIKTNKEEIKKKIGDIVNIEHLSQEKPKENFMVEPNFTRIAYQTLQQGKSIAGLAHKELSTKLMEWFAPEAMPNTKPLPFEMFAKLRKSMAAFILKEHPPKKKCSG